MSLWSIQCYQMRGTVNLTGRSKAKKPALAWSLNAFHWRSSLLFSCYLGMTQLWNQKFLNTMWKLICGLFAGGIYRLRCFEHFKMHLCRIEFASVSIKELWTDGEKLWRWPLHIDWIFFKLSFSFEPKLRGGACENQCCQVSSEC